MTLRELELAARADPELHLAPVHVFSFRGRRFGFFIRTGDLVGLGEAAARALELVEAGLSGEELREGIVRELGPEAAGAVLDDIETLEAAGLLRPEVELTTPERLQQYEGLLQHQPRNLMFFVTEACNLACTYCYEKNQGVHDGGRSLKQVDARRIIDRFFEEMPRRKQITITFFGGEPLLNPKVIRDTVAYAKEKAAERGQEIGFTMTSNLTLLNEDMAEFLARESFHVMVSLDGDREANDRHRVFANGKGSYDTTVKNLKLLIDKMRAHGVRLPKIRATLTAGSADPVETELHLASLGTPLVEIGETHGTVFERASYDVADETLERMVESTRDFVDRLLDQLAEDPQTIPPIPPSVRKTLRLIHEEVSRQHVHESAAPSLCGVCRNMKAVTPGGDLYPCHRYVGMPAFKLGNIHNGGMDREKVRDYYDRIYDVYAEKCAPCWLRHLCGGQCPWYLSGEDGAIAAPDDATCDSMRAGYERHLGLYATLLHRFPEAFEAYVGTASEEVQGCCKTQPFES